ncbi:MAG: methyltransferase domain-containing protein [Niveispirillum sp.]|nr:methyltransferase domain-containing protein [Niveispirillum sp.]
MAWNPDLYERYRALRERPGQDLLSALPDIMPGIITDLGCGTGYLTRQLADRFAAATVTGLDSDAAMLAKAAGAASRVFWRQCDIGEWQPDAPSDLIFSNAALHWLPDHAGLFARLAGFLASGGVLAVQMPDNFAAPSHRLLAGLAAREPWRDTLAGALDHGTVLRPDEYWRVLRPHCHSIDIWHSEYLQVLEGDDPVLEWVSATALLPVTSRLSPDQAAAFRAAYGAALRDAYPVEADGSTLFPFRRIFILARI